MMHCMVTRRQRVPGRKKGSSLVNDSLNAGLATLMVDQQQQGHARRRPHHPRPQHPVTLHESAELELCGGYGDDGHHAEVDNCDDEDDAPPDLPKADHGRTRGEEEEASGECDEGSCSTGPLQRLSRVGNAARQCSTNPPRVADAGGWDGRSGGEAKQLEEIRLGPTLLTSLSFKGGTTRVVTPEKLLTADDATGKFAYISLDGRLINAELATSATSIGGGLGDKEALAWEDFAPMQRVLIVAVSAAAAAAAKHKNRREVDRLLKTVMDRENELILMRQQLSGLCKQSMITDPAAGMISSSLTSRTAHPELPLASHRDAAADLPSPKTPIAHRDAAAMRRFRMEGGKTDPELPLQQSHESTGPPAKLTLGDSDDLTDDDDDDDDFEPSSRDPPVNKDVVLVETTSCCRADPSRSDWPSTSLGDLGWAKEQQEAKWYVNPMVVEAGDPHYYDICTPERSGNPGSMLSTCTPAVRGSLEWMAVRSSFTCRLLLPLEAAGDLRQQSSLPRLEDEEARQGEWNVLSRARCAAVLLDLKKQVLAVLDKEASKLMATRDITMEEARAQIASMRSAVAGCWQTMAPQALAALGLSPSEFDICLLNDAQGSMIRSNNGVPKAEESIMIHAWRQYLEKGIEHGRSSHAATPGSQLTILGAASASGAGGPQLTTLHAPGIDAACQNNGGTRFTSAHGSENSAEYIAEQLLGELDKAAAKVADMESQIRKLEQNVAECDAKRLHAEHELAGSIHRDLENQVKVQLEIAELTRQLRSKEIEMAGLEQSRKVMLMVKNKEIAELREDCSRRDAELDEITAAAQATKAANTDRIAMLEDLCRRKDSAIFDLKQEILALEAKVHSLGTFQSPAVLRGRRSFMSNFAPPAPISTGFGSAPCMNESQRTDFFQETPTTTSDPVQHEHFESLQRELPGDAMRSRFRVDLPSIHTRRSEEVTTDDGRSEHGCDQESSRDFSSPPGSTIGDDYSELEHSLQALSVDEEASEHCEEVDSGKFQTPKLQIPALKPNAGERRLTKQKSAGSSDGRRGGLTSSTSSSIRGMTRVRASHIFTSAASGSSGESKQQHASRSTGHDRRREYNVSPRTSLGSSSMKVLGSVAPNTPVHRRASSLDLKGGDSSFIGAGGSLDSGFKENATSRRRRWV